MTIEDLIIKYCKPSIDDILLRVSHEPYYFYLQNSKPEYFDSMNNCPTKLLDKEIIYWEVITHHGDTWVEVIV